jgi:hypothetical protein
LNKPALLNHVVVAAVLDRLCEASMATRTGAPARALENVPNAKDVTKPGQAGVDMTRRR